MCETGHGTVGKRCIGREGDAAGGATATAVGHNASGAVQNEDENSLVVVEENGEGHKDGNCTRGAKLVHGDASHILGDAVAAAAVVVVLTAVGAVMQCSDSASPHVVDVVLRNIRSGGAVLGIRFFPSRAFPSRTTPQVVSPARPKPTANRSSSNYEIHGSDLAGPVAVLDGGKAVKTRGLNVVVVVVMEVLVLSVIVRILGDAVLEAVVGVVTVGDDGVVKAGVVADVIGILTKLGGGVKKLKKERLELAETETDRVAGVVGRGMQVVDGRIVAVRTTRHCDACPRH